VVAFSKKCQTVLTTTSFSSHARILLGPVDFENLNFAGAVNETFPILCR
jgi:hypothetical protein